LGILLSTAIFDLLPYSNPSESSCAGREKIEFLICANKTYSRILISYSRILIVAYLNTVVYTKSNRGVDPVVYGYT